MSAPNRNTLWARVLADAWALLGVEHVCVGSGSRSAPLVEAFARDDRFFVHPHVDERSAAFFALGVGAATGRPAIVVTTSGTASANLLPAIVEASQGEIPLLAVTADRPASLRLSDANQTIDQVRLFGGYPRYDVDLALPEMTEEALTRLRMTASEAWAATLGPAHGPAHVNVQFEKPLEPTLVPGDVPEGWVANRDPSSDPMIELAPRADASGALRRQLAHFRRPLMVCGPAHDPEWGRAALRLARAMGAPLIADPLSGARFGPEAEAYTVGGADLFLASDRVAEALKPDVIVRVGAAPVTSATVLRFLGRQHPGAPAQVVVAPAIRFNDHLGVASHALVGDPVSTLDGAGGAARSEDGWLARWRALDEAVRQAVAPAVGGEWFEGAVAATIADLLPAGATWFIGNSMPIRDVDAFAGRRTAEVRTIGLRGASGIDGNVSAAIGAAVARGKPAVALLGDLTLLHDVNALFAQRRIDVSLQIVVLQNRGGGIFHMLPIREHDPPFTPYVVMPHAVDFAAVAQAAGIPHRPIASLDVLREALDVGFGVPGIQMLELAVEREQNWERRNAVVARARTAAEGAL